MRELTLHERIRNADASQQVENVKAKHAYRILTGQLISAAPTPPASGV